MNASPQERLAALPTLGTLMIPTDLFPNGPDRLAYACRLGGHCLEPEVFENDTAICSPAAQLVAGKFVMLWWRDDSPPSLKRLVRVPAALPGELRFVPPVTPRIYVEMLNPHGIFAVGLDRLRAVHLVVAILTPEQRLRAEQIALPAPRPATERRARA